MNDIEKAVSRFKEDYSCSQAIFSAFGSRFGINEQTALKIASTFGGGMARMGNTCGAVTGAFMVIGLKHGHTNPEDEELKEEVYRIVNRFADEFKSRNGSIFCRELLGYELSDPEQRQTVNEKGLPDTICVKLVRDSAEILEKLL